MQKSRSSSSMRSVIAGAMAMSAQPVVEIKSYALAGEGLARVLVEVTHTTESRNDPSVIASALKTRMDERMEVVAGSFTSIEKGAFVERITGLVSTVRNAIAVNEDSMKGFKAVASNMFMDDEQDMWVLRKTQAGSLLVQTTGIDDDLSLINLLDSCSSAGFRNSPDYGRLTAQASSVARQVNGGDFVSYVDISNIINIGYVVATASDSDDVLVLPAFGEEAEAIKRTAITEIHAQDNFPEHAPTPEQAVDQVVAAARGVVDMEKIIDYYRHEYARSPKFFQMMVDRLKSHQFM